MASVYTGAERRIHSEPCRPFAGDRVYYSPAIRGVGAQQPDITQRLVHFMAQWGAEVLSEHVGGSSPEERDYIFRARTGFDLGRMPEPWKAVRCIDTQWVDSATHLVAVVDGPSHGVGMEIERALLKPERGLAQTPILCLIHETLLDRLSWMVRGVSNPDFFLKTYCDADEAEQLVTDFLQRSCQCLDERASRSQM